MKRRYLEWRKKETQMIGSLFGQIIKDEGAKGLSEGLKVNTTLTELNLKSEEETRKGKGKERTKKK